MQVNTTLIEQVSAMLRGHMGDDFDPVAFWDTLDGEADVLDIADRILAKRAEDKALADAAKAMAKDLSDRAARIASREDAHKRALMMILDAAGQKKLERPQATISKQSGRLGVQITNADDVPTQLCKTTVTPDKTAIKAQIDAGETVPGAELVRGPDSLTIRTK